MDTNLQDATQIPPGRGGRPTSALPARAGAHPSAPPSRPLPSAVAHAGQVTLTVGQEAIAHDCSCRALQDWARTAAYRALSTDERRGVRRAIAVLDQLRATRHAQVREAFARMDQVRDAVGL